MIEKQRTISKPISLKGLGLHSGENVEIKINPAPENKGYIFKRLDLEGHPTIRAIADNVVSTDRGTTIQEKGINMSLDELKALVPITDRWVKEGNPPPLLFTSDRFARSADVFPIEILDIL